MIFGVFIFGFIIGLILGMAWALDTEVDVIPNGPKPEAPKPKPKP